MYLKQSLIFRGLLFLYLCLNYLPMLVDVEPVEYFLMYCTSLKASVLFAACFYPFSLLATLVEIGLAASTLKRLPRIEISHMKPLMFAI